MNDGAGAAIALALAEDGWPVAVNYRSDAEGAREVVERIAAGGAQALELQADVADESSVNQMFDTHDRLVGGLPKPDWQRVIDVNLHGVFHTVSRAMRPEDSR